MDYSYIAYTQDKKLVKGKVTAENESDATRLLNYGGYQVVNLKAVVPFINTKKLSSYFNKVKSTQILMFSRQLALLIRSGTDIVTALELVQSQVDSSVLSNVIGEIISDIRGGKSLSAAISRHPGVFPAIYPRAIAAGEQGGNLDIVLNQMAEFIERSMNTKKKIKGALAYPVMVAVVALIVVTVLVTYVLPQYNSLFEAFGADVPLITRILMNITNWSSSYGIYVILAILIGVIGTFTYVQTSNGRYNWDKFTLNMPVIGRINLLNELAYMCRIVALLFKVGLPLPEIMTMAVNGTSNKIVSETLTSVHQELVRGEGLARPMSRRKIFLPLLVQMVAVGEETGNLDTTLTTVAESYEMESDERTRAAIGLIQPTLTIVIGLIVAFVAIALVSSMYGVFGQVDF